MQSQKLPRGQHGQPNTERLNLLVSLTWLSNAHTGLRNSRRSRQLLNSRSVSQTTAPPLSAYLMGDCNQPSRELLRIAQITQFPIRSEEYLLGQIGGHVEVARGVIAYRPYQAHTAIIQFGKRRPVPVEHA
jgi:hypothetical protein